MAIASRYDPAPEEAMEGIRVRTSRGSEKTHYLAMTLK